MREKENRVQNGKEQFSKDKTLSTTILPAEWCIELSS